MGESNKCPHGARALLLFPGALGDFLCWLPAALSLASRFAGGVRVAARAEWLQLLRDPRIEAVSIDRREISELFRSEAHLSSQSTEFFDGISVIHSWTGHGDTGFAERLRQRARAEIFVHPFRNLRPGEHAVDYYARCAGVRPSPTSISSLNIARPHSETISNAAQQGRWLLMHPGSGARHKNWSGFGELAALWREKVGASVVVLSGPAEVERGDLPAAADLYLTDRPLSEVAGWLTLAPVYVGNDSGISHLADILGAPGVVLFAESDAGAWGPRNASLKVIQAAPACQTCGPRHFCTHRLGVQEVLQAALRCLETEVL